MTKILASSFCLAVVLAGCGKNDRELSAAVQEPAYRIVSGGCVLHLATGLYWEVKSDKPGLHDWHNTYSWFNPHESQGELDYRGTQNGGECAGSECDTWDYVRAVNAAGLCGFSDWRAPSRDELNSISELQRAAAPPTADPEFFPHTQAAEYWTANDYSFQYDAAWAWNFQYGHDRVDWKKSPKNLRLTRGEAERLAPVKE